MNFLMEVSTFNRDSSLSKQRFRLKVQDKISYLYSRVHSMLFSIPRGTVDLAASRLQEDLDTEFPGIYSVASIYGVDGSDKFQFGSILVRLKEENNRIYLRVVRNFDFGLD